MAAALLAYDAKIVTNQRPGLTIGELLGDGSNGSADHLLAPGETIRSIELPAPLQNERALYKRAISRSHAEWPLAEVCARAVVSGGVFQFVRVTAGGIAPVPLRLAACEAALQGKPASAAVIAEAARQATSGARPLPMTGYKLDLLEGVVHDLLERLASRRRGQRRACAVPTFLAERCEWWARFALPTLLRIARQHPRQMLNLPSTGLLRARAEARAEVRRDSLRDASRPAG